MDKNKEHGDVSYVVAYVAHDRLPSVMPDCMIIAGLLACRNVLLQMYGPDKEGDKPGSATWSMAGI